MSADKVPSTEHAFLPEKAHVIRALWGQSLASESQAFMREPTRGAKDVVPKRKSTMTRQYWPELQSCRVFNFSGV